MRTCKPYRLRVILTTNLKFGILCLVAFGDPKVFFHWLHQNCCDLKYCISCWCTDVLIFFQIVSNTQRKPKRRITVDSPVRSRVLPSTTPELRSVMAETWQCTNPELKSVMVETLQSSTPELKSIAVNTPHSKHDITVNSLGLDFHAEKGNSIFVSRPAIVSKNSGSFSLQHLGQSPFTFSLDHLRSEWSTVSVKSCHLPDLTHQSFSCKSS